MIEERKGPKNHVVLPIGMNIEEMEAEPENKEHWIPKCFRKLEAIEPVYKKKEW